MQQADVKGIKRSLVVTGEQRFFGPVYDDEQKYCAYRSGVPVREALEHAHCLAGAVQRSLEELASRDKETEMSGTLWSLSYVMETVLAATHAALNSPQLYD